VRGSRLKPWQRGLALLLATLMATTPVAARGPGRAGIADLVEEPDQLPLSNPAAPYLDISLEPTQTLPGTPTVAGGTVDAKGDQPITVSLDATRGGPAGMTLGQPVLSNSGELMVPLLGVPSNATVDGHGTTPGVTAHIGQFDPVPPLVSLKAVPVPPVQGLEYIVRDQTALIALGKALFWDSKVGSDGQACASCHFAAGADNRLKNQLNPGQRGGDNTFNRTFTGGGGPNYTLKPADFPFFRLQNPFDRNSPIVFESNDVVSSQGTFSGEFQNLLPNAGEKCAARPIDEFSVHGALTRRVAPRNAPTVINAVYNYRNFWDGRANNVFNGNNPFGDRDTSSRVLQAQPNGQAAWVRLHLPNASLASQAVGPALSDFEMSCASKTFQHLGRKMVPMRALSAQKVHAQDSVLAPYRDASGVGLRSTYDQLIKAAFLPEWWSAPGLYDGFTQVENNFAMLWGIAIMAYETTLVSDEAPIDRYVGWSGSPPDATALSPQEQRGLAIFRGGKALCASCHRGAEFTSAGTSLQPTGGETNPLEQMFVGAGQIGLYDSGFYNIGVRPTSEDVGLGGTDAFGNPLSYSRQYVSRLRGNATPDLFQVDTCMFAIKSDVNDCWVAPSPQKARVGVDGAFKTPSLRNIALTQPYFHNGSRFTLEQVVEFYNRGGDRRGPDDNDTSGLPLSVAPDGGLSNVHPAIHPLGLTVDETKDLVAFLRNALTDRRVACQQAPFDHPALRIFNGHVGNATTVTLNRTEPIKAADAYIDLPESGAGGVAPAMCQKSDVGTSFATTP
jgi:cytochrome c peroxidase